MAEWTSETAFNNFAPIGWVVENQGGSDYVKTHMCRVCGTVVYERAKHIEWHARHPEPIDLKKSL